MQTVYVKLSKINIENNIKRVKSLYLFKTKKNFEINKINLLLLNTFSIELELISNLAIHSNKITQKKEYQNLKFLNLLHIFKSVNKDIPFQYLFEKKNHNFFFNFFDFWEKNKKSALNIFTPSIYNFYNTSIVNQNSPLMLECSLFLNKKSNFYNFYEIKKT